MLRALRGGLADLFILARALQGPVSAAELGRRMGAVEPGWDEALARRRVEALERAGVLRRDGKRLALTPEGRRAAGSAMALLGRVLDDAALELSSLPREARAAGAARLRPGAP